MKQVYEKNKRGISLIMLVITIIVAVILISAVLLSLDKNDPRKGASENVFKSDFRTLQEELAIKKTEIKNQDSMANVNVNVSYDEDEELKTWMESIDSSILNGIVAICNGDLVFIDNNMSEEEKKWANEISKVVDSCEEYNKKRGGYYFKAQTVEGQEVENYTWTNKDVIVSVDDQYADTLKEKYNSFIYSIDSLQYNEYSDSTKIRISTDTKTTKIATIKGVAKSADDESVEPIDFIENFVVKIDKVSPIAPDIITSTDVYGNVQLTLSGAKDEDSGINSIYYSTDLLNWIKYDATVTLDKDVTQVWSKSVDNASNETPEDEYKTAKVQTEETVTLSVTSPAKNIYREGTLIKFEATFSNRAPATAPTLNINFGEGTIRTATVVNISQNKIIYNYTIQSSDNGKLNLVDKYYNKDIQLLGNEIIADTINPAFEFVSAKYNGVTGTTAEIIDKNDVVVIDFKATDLNINNSYLTANDITLLFDGIQMADLNKTLTTIKSGNSFNYSLTLTGFSSQSGKVSLKIPGRRVCDLALNDYNWNDEILLDTNYTIVSKIDETAPKITSIEMTSNNDVGGEKYAKNGNTITLKVKFDENLGTVPTISIAGKKASLTSSAPGASEYVATIQIPTNEASLTQGYLGYSISGYKDLSGNLGKTVEKTTVTTKPSSITDTVLYDREKPSADVEFKYYKADLKTEITTGSYAYQAKFIKFVISDNLSGEKIKQYQWTTSNNTPTSGWKNITSTTNVEEKTTTGKYFLHIKVIDNSGNETTTYKQINIDRTPPSMTVTLTPVNGSAFNVKKTNADIRLHDTITWVNASHKGVKNEVSTTESESGLDCVNLSYNSGGNYSSFSTTIAGTSTYTTASFTRDVVDSGCRYWEFVAYDKVGNSRKIKVYAKIDQSLPKVTLTMNYKNASGTSINTDNTNGYAYSVTPSVAVTDVGSGKNTVQFSKDNKTWSSTYAPPTTTGTHTMYVRATDKAGNTSTVVSKTFKIDRTAPSLTVKLTPVNGSSFSVTKTNGDIKLHDTITWVNASHKGVKNEVSTTESESGLDCVKLPYNSGGNYSSFSTKIAGTSTFTTASFTKNVVDSGCRYWELVAYDKVGNSRKIKVYAKIDQNLPTVALTLTYKNKSGTSINTDNTNGYAYSISPSVTVTDVGSGKKTEQYSKDNKTWSSSYTPPTTTGTHTIYVRATDKAGNTSKVVSKTFKIDRTPPKAGITSISSTSIKNLTINAEGIDTHSKVKKIEYYVNSSNKGNKTFSTLKEINSGALTLSDLSKGKKYTSYVKVYDSVGNSTDSKSVPKYTKCSHNFGTYKGSVSADYKNYVIGEYWWTGWWECYGVDGSSNKHYHRAVEGKPALLSRCIYCGVTKRELYVTDSLYGVSGNYKLWCPVNTSYSGLDSNKYNANGNKIN